MSTSSLSHPSGEVRCGSCCVDIEVLLLEDLGVLFLGVAALLACGRSSHFSPAVAHVLTAPAPAVTLMTPSLPSEDAWDHIARSPVTQGPPDVEPFFNHTHTSLFCPVS